MLTPRNLTPFKVGQKRELPNKASELPPFASRHSSTVSLASRIQRHLDAGKPLYIGFDPNDPPRDSTDVSRTYQGAGELGWGAGFGKRVSRHKKWLRVLAFGVPLDIAAKFILTIGTMVALFTLLWAINRLIRIENRKLEKDFNLVLVIGQCIWGVFFGASCIFGMELMWGKWRRSPSVALFFTVSWVLVSLALLVNSAVWIFFYLTLRATRIEKCLGKTIKVTITWDKDSLHRMAPQAQIDRCLDKVGSKINWALVWGIVYALFSYFGLIVVLWGRDYRRRLLEIREAKKPHNSSENDKVGLLLGTTPLGRFSSSRVVVQRETSPEGGQDGTRPSRTNAAEPAEQQRDTRNIIRTPGSVKSYESQVNMQVPQTKG